jgi:sialic acid synthase SpsE
VYASFDIMNVPKTDFPWMKKLYCIPEEYPVKYEISWGGIFPIFDGFSSHCLGIKQELKAIENGAEIIEFHITLDKNDINCPDHCFAKRPRETEYLIKQIKCREPNA